MLQNNRPSRLPPGIAHYEREALNLRKNKLGALFLYARQNTLSF